jgi:sporulation protein YlmC with PRC-barrel domain
MGPSLACWNHRLVAAFIQAMSGDQSPTRDGSFGQRMSGKYLIAALFGIALISAPALAQTITETSDATSLISQDDAAQWRSSKLIGMNVYNNGNEKIGVISDMLVDQNGKIKGIILSVGGFLVMGKHLIAVKFENIKWVKEAVPNTTTPNRAPPAPNAMGTTYPDHALLNATKDQLKSMPEFSGVSEN